MKWLVPIARSAALCALLNACTSGQTPGPPINAVNPNYGTLQFRVGTANLYGSGASALNVVSTLRQPNGRSAYGVDTPKITGPFTFTTGPAPANGSLSDPYTTIPGNGPSLMEATASLAAISATPQTVAPGTPFCDGVGAVPSGFTSCPGSVSPDASTFGESGGVFAMGLAPYNTLAETAQSYSYAPYAQPMYDTTGHLQFVPWGGPPAFDPDGNGMGTRDGLQHLDFDSFGDPYFLGIGEGVTIFENVAPTAGSYKMTVTLSINTSGSPQSLTLSASATLSSLALLPSIAAPVVTPDANGDGGAVVTVGASSFPSGVTEALIQIIDYGPGAGPNHGGGTASNCQGPKGPAFAPVYYTLEVTGPGAYTLGSSHGPNTNLNGGASNLTPSPTICTAAQNAAAGAGSAGDNITVQIIGFDYPDYEAAVSLIKPTTPQAPQLAGANGQSDITVSVPEEEDYPAYSQSPLSARRHTLRHAFTYGLRRVR